MPETKNGDHFFTPIICQNTFAMCGYHLQHTMEALCTLEQQICTAQCTVQFTLHNIVERIKTSFLT